MGGLNKLSFGLLHLKKCDIYYWICVKSLKSGGVFRYSYHRGSCLREYFSVGCLSWNSIKNVILVVLTGKPYILYSLRNGL